MTRGLYRKLAWTGICKNKKFFIPYILTCAGMVMMCYIVSFLSTSPTISKINGGVTMQSFLFIGFGVMCIFSLIFLFYTNSFLVRRRKKEFGLYNILGMGKRNIALVLVWETLIITAITVCGGLFFGILFSKFAELGMVRILGASADFSFSIGFQPILQTLILFGVIFILIFLNTLRQIHTSNPIELLHSENAGEKPPKANWLIALLGAIILGGAYYLAVSIKDPVAAINWFFIAVVMVIIATYMLFVAGSVTICRLLQKNKKYYYKTNHFVSVSSMVYRMKRNGAGLASICILCTMVLVMISSTVCLYMGTEDTLRTTYPRDINIDINLTSIDDINSEIVEQINNITRETSEQNGVSPENILSYRLAGFAALLENGEIFNIGENMYSDFSRLWQIFIVPIEDYNRIMGTDEILSENEAIIYTTKSNYDGDTIKIADSTYTIKKHADNFKENRVGAIQIVPSIYIFIPNFEEKINSLIELTITDEYSLIILSCFYGFDLSCDDDIQIEIYNQLYDNFYSQNGTGINDENNIFFSISSVAQTRGDFYSLYGGLFFLGIVLGIVFIFAAVLIIYYKQISEGYEDQSRFDIMQKVGMTKKEIRKSINSQILTVFFMPLITAGIHLAFAFPLIQKLLLLFGLANIEFLVMVTVCCYLVFAVFYALVYRITSRSYFSIVSDMKE